LKRKLFTINYILSLELENSNIKILKLFKHTKEIQRLIKEKESNDLHCGEKI
jgi:hypothetical protein